MLPGIAKVIEVTEGLAPHALECLCQGRFASIKRAIKTIRRIGDAEARVAEGQFPQVAVRPRQRCLEDTMQPVEADTQRHFDDAAHHRHHIIQRDRHPCDEGVAQAACSRFWIS